MRYLFGFLCVCAVVGTSPLSVSAQAGEEEVGSRLERWHPEAFVDPASKPTPSEPASEGPALQLELDSAGVEVVPSPPRTVDGYTLEETELRVRRTKIGLGISGGVFVGGVGMIASAVILGRGRTELSELQEAHYGRPRRVQWDLAQSRVVF